MESDNQCQQAYLLPLTGPIASMDATTMVYPKVPGREGEAPQLTSSTGSSADSQASESPLMKRNEKDDDMTSRRVSDLSLAFGTEEEQDAIARSCKVESLGPEGALSPESDSLTSLLSENQGPPPNMKGCSTNQQHGTTPSSFLSTTSSYGSTTLTGQLRYSAIGSLEDPASSLKKSSGDVGPQTKIDFPSCGPLVAPKKAKGLPNGSQQASFLLANSSSHRRTKKSSLTTELEASPVETASLEAVQAAVEKPALLNSKPNAIDPRGDSKLEQETPEGASRRKKSKKKKKQKEPTEKFCPISLAHTPMIGKRDLKKMSVERRTTIKEKTTPLGSLSRPNFRHALGRVSMILRKHIIKIESRFEKEKEADKLKHDRLFSNEMRDVFSQDNFVIPRYRCSMVRVPMARPGMVFGLKEIRQDHQIPSENEIYEFALQLFDTVQLSSECSIVCLIYVERLMEAGQVPLMACTWRPVFMCGLLLASKVWQDLSSWNVEFASVYPQFSIDAINKLEILFLRTIKWDLYISSSLYAKYYFALRSVVSRSDFRNRYNQLVGVIEHEQAKSAQKVEKRSTKMKKVLAELSASM